MNPQATEGTGYRFYSFGILSEDKEKNTDLIKVTPIEELPLAVGVLKKIKLDYKGVKGVDHQGKDVNADIKGGVIVVAKWAPFETNNRQTAPNVYAGESVMLMKFGNTDDIYWMDMFREPELRRLEHVVYSFSNLKEKGKAFDEDTAVMLTFSTREQFIRLQTPHNRDEKAGYDIKIDMAKGKITVEDTKKNTLTWDSVAGSLVGKFNKLFKITAPDIILDGETEVTKNLNVVKEVTATWKSSPIKLTKHKHLYNPGPGGPSPSQPPLPGG